MTMRMQKHTSLRTNPVFHPPLRRGRNETAMNATVTDIKSKPTPDTDPNLSGARAFVAARALYSLKVLLTAQLARSQAEWGKVTGEAKDAFFKPLRAEETGMSVRRRAEAQTETRAALAAWDSLKSEAKADKDARLKKIGRVNAAFGEVMGVSKDDGLQTDIFGGAETGAIPGLGWASAETKAMIYTALVQISESKVAMSDVQSALLLDLASAGLEAVDLGIDASEAVEQDVTADGDPGEYVPDETDQNVPF